ncbi:MAG: MBL fold metallo-hydrolase [Roseburia sp.]|nr:MBL fold metallo-hydrolase [Roseburia sp.]
MKFEVGGGVGEHGRNCFYVSDGINYIVDCGIMRKAKQPFPRLSSDQINMAKYLFLTHPHEDHIGAFDWLIKNGFHGMVVGMPETISEITNYPHKFLLQRDKKEYIFDDIAFCYGRSGHCVGSVWYKIKTDSEVFFSGDYSEHSSFCVDRICGLSSDLAIIDCAYGYQAYNASAQLQKIISYIIQHSESKVLLPVPKNGRAVDILSALQSYGLKIGIDKKLKDFIKDYGNDNFWLKENACKTLIRQQHISFNDTNSSASVLFIADAQLAQENSKNLVYEILNQGGKVLITGHTDCGEESDNLLQSGLADKIPFNAHCCKSDVEGICARNSFKNVICYHTEAIPL